VENRRLNTGSLPRKKKIIGHVVGCLRTLKIQEYPTLPKFCHEKGQFNHTTPRQI
jgi:hypothetical protein